TFAGVHLGDAEENLKLRISTSYLDTPTIKETEELVNLYNEQGGEFINTETHPETLLLIEKLKRLFS
ncbi:hypothetical protein KC614_02430, partial [candidate division WWE3 bacterium]|nr:hypothetical protein [candidate division WWE3 bacterium]